LALAKGEGKAQVGLALAPPVSRRDVWEVHPVAGGFDDSTPPAILQREGLRLQVQVDGEQLERAAGTTNGEQGVWVGFMHIRQREAGRLAGEALVDAQVISGKGTAPTFFDVCQLPEEDDEAVARGRGVERVQEDGVKTEEVLPSRRHRLGNKISRGCCAHRQLVGEGPEKEGGVKATVGLGAEGEAEAEVLAEDVAVGRLGGSDVPQEARNVQAQRGHQGGGRTGCAVAVVWLHSCCMRKRVGASSTTCIEIVGLRFSAESVSYSTVFFSHNKSTNGTFSQAPPTFVLLNIVDQIYTRQADNSDQVQR